MRGLSQAALGEAVGISQPHIGSLERGTRRLTLGVAAKLAAALDCAPADLMAGADGLSVPLTLAIAFHHSEERPADFDMAEPHRRIQAPPRLAAPERCFAAEVADTSCDRLYPPGSLLICREVEPGHEVKVGARAVVRRFVAPGEDDGTFEVLVGVIDRTITGDVVLLLQSTDRTAPASVPVQTRSSAPFRLSESQVARLPRAASFTWEPRPGDAGAILGTVAWALMPEEEAAPAANTSARRTPGKRLA